MRRAREALERIAKSPRPRLRQVVRAVEVRHRGSSDNIGVLFSQEVAGSWDKLDPQVVGVGFVAAELARRKGEVVCR
jgi:hypothetical protein